MRLGRTDLLSVRVFYAKLFVCLMLQFRWFAVCFLEKLPGWCRGRCRAQPLAAMLPYGCGLPFTGTHRPDLSASLCSAPPLHKGRLWTAQIPWLPLRRGAVSRRLTERSSPLFYSGSFARPASTSFCTLMRMPSFAWCHVRPPWKYTAYGARIGPSADSSIDEPCTNAPAAMTTSAS